MATAAVLTTYVGFGAIGLLFGRVVRAKPSTVWWIVLALFVVLSQWILPGTRVIDIFDFKMYGNQALQALSVGLLIGLLTKHAK